MCDPLTLIMGIGGAVASTVGAGMQAGEAAKTNARIAESRNKVLRQTNAMNDEHAAKNRQALNQRVADSGKAKADQQLATAQDTAVDQITQNLAPTATDIPLSGAAPKVVGNSLSTALGDVAKESQARAADIGMFQGYGLNAQDNALGDLGLRDEIGVNNDYVRGNMSIMPYLQDFAEYKAASKAKSSPLGSILLGLGKALPMYSGAGM